MDNSAAEPTLHAVALERKNYLFAGSYAGGARAVAIYSTLGTPTVNGYIRLKTVSVICVCLFGFRGDITTATTQNDMLSACPNPDILINNAGAPPLGDFRDIKREDWIEDQHTSQKALSLDLIATNNHFNI